MKLPDGDRAVVPSAKLTAYLLSDTHPVGRSKAHVFRSVGFTPATADRLAQELLLLARSEEIVAQVDSPHGTKYVVDGTLATPRGDPLHLRTVWIIELGHDAPRFVTAYPR
ncbi:MAG TPA: hypothetical protein VIU62_13620 [Chloroflexota bacterium]|jgi:hypothetical protein